MNATSTSFPFPIHLANLHAGKDGEGPQCPNLLFQLPLFLHDQGSQLVNSLVGQTNSYETDYSE